MRSDEAIVEALALHRQGRLAEAEAAYHRVLHADPRHAGALHLLGLARFQRGDLVAAASLIARSIGLDERNAVAHNNHGAVLLALRRLEEALTAFDRALALKPDYAEALNNGGNALLGLGRAGEALDRYRRALQAGLRNATLLCNLGSALHSLGRLEEALAAFDEAIALDAGHADAHVNRGETLRLLKRREEALASFERAIALAPDRAEPFNGRGTTLFEMDRLEEALRDYDRAIAADPRRADVHGNKARTFLRLGRFEDALASCDKSLDLGSGGAEVHMDRAAALVELRRLEEALPSMEKALALDPDLPLARGFRLHIRMHLCEWRDFDAECERVIRSTHEGKRASPPFPLLALPASAATQLACAQSSVRHQYPPSAAPLWRGEAYAHDRIRIGYFSADFHNHATAHLITGLLERHDRSRFEVTAFSFGQARDDPWRRRLENGVERFLDVSGSSNRQIAATARQMEIDIAVDLKGFTSGARTAIFAMRPAPVQVNYLGYPGTLGAPYMDYLVADATVIPPEHEAFYEEKIAYLPDCYQPNDSTRRISERTFRRPELGLPEGGFVFCCFNSSFKITPEVFDVWMRLLRQVPGSVLWLFEAPGTAQANLRAAAGERGVAGDRLVFGGYLELEEHFARIRQADLFLDTFTYNAHTTASDALWAGLPVVTRLGETFASRVAASLLRAIGLPELITRTPSEYEALALGLATHPGKLATIRAKLADHRTTHPLFDTERYARNIESAFSTMHERQRRGMPPARIVVPARTP